MNNQKHLRIIIIDDNPDIHRDFIKILTISNHASKLSELDRELFGEKSSADDEDNLPQFDIETASQGEEGVEKIKKALEEGSPFALAFIDIRMPPGIDGIETIKRIWEFDQDIQVVICTAYSDYSWEETVKALGLSDSLLILKKPFDVVAVRQLAGALTHKWLIAKDTRQHTLSLKRLVSAHTASLKESLALLRVTIESSFDGILVVDLKGKIIDFNKQFVKYLKLPEALLNQNDEASILQHMLDQMAEPKKYMKIYNMHISKNEGSSRQTIKLKNLQVFECYSKPHSIGSKIVGRVWSFHDITEQIKLKEKLEYQATHDALTGLPNRSLLLDRIWQEIAIAERNKNKFTVLFLDLDRFKFVNDNLSHETGDQLLCAIAERLTSVLRKADTLARLGGDEFVLVLPGITNEEIVVAIGNKLMEVFSKPFQVKKHKIKITASIGISIYPNDGINVNTLLRNADLSMYQAKAQGGNQFTFYTEELNQKSEYQFKLEVELQRAITNHEFFLIYQPQFDIVSKNIMSVEALLRWQHPDKGVIMPLDFIQVAENTGLIIPIGEWVIEEACKQIVEWHKQGLPLIKVAVNIATKQLRQVNFPVIIQKIIQSHQLNPGCLELEITENVIIDKEIRQVIKQLNKIGCKIVLDDFGTGNSSLNSLKKLHIDRLKIDQSFVNNIAKSPGDEAIVEAIIAISHSMNFRVVAEGVETKDQMDFLMKNHCDEIQGFLWSEPLSSDQLVTLINKQKTKKE
ncbi:MAG: EAL domain-containing protein [Legionella sp.]|nr:EAL domain-containing protein [Legionella sp.]